jgi:hypothetical protein
MPNGLAQAQRRDRGAATTIIASLLAGCIPSAAQTHCRLEPMLGCLSRFEPKFKLRYLKRNPYCFKILHLQLRETHTCLFLEELHCSVESKVVKGFGAFR